VFSQLRNLLIAKYAHSCYDSDEERAYKNGVAYMGKLTSRVEKLYLIFRKAAGLRAVLHFVGRGKESSFWKRSGNLIAFLQAMICLSPCP